MTELQTIDINNRNKERGWKRIVSKLEHEEKMMEETLSRRFTRGSVIQERRSKSLNIIFAVESD